MTTGSDALRSRFCLSSAGFFSCLFVSLSLSSAPATAQTFTYFAVPTANAQPRAVAVGSDGLVYFTEAGSTTSKIGVLTPSTGGIQELPISGGNLNTMLEASDGQVWVSETNTNALASIAPSTAASPFAIGTSSIGGANVYPTAFALATDGNFWIWGNGPDQFLARPPGVTTPIRSSTSATNFTSVTSIAASSGGFIWYAGSRTLSKSVTGAIGRHDTRTGESVYFNAAGSTYPKPSNPFGITAGPDGNMWFTDQGANAIGRITLTGAFQMFPLPTASANPAFIVTGADGAMYFTENAVNKIGRIDSTGAITEYALPTSPFATHPYAITADPSGPIWFTTLDGNAIGRFDPPASTSPLLASVLPSSRSVQTPHLATVFASMINTSATTLNACGIVAVTPLPGTFTSQTTDPNTNAIVGPVNGRVSIPANGLQTFVLAISPNGPLAPTVVEFGYQCVGAGAAAAIPGVNTLQLTFSTTPVADMIAVGLTSSRDGYAHTSGVGGTGLFVIATSNVGSAETLTARAHATSASTPVTINVCETNPATGVCKAPPAPTVSRSVAASENATWAAFAVANGAIAQDPVHNRLVFEFIDAAGVIRGSTSTALTSQ